MIRITRVMAESRLRDVPEGKRFWCFNGKVIGNLRELLTALHSMNEETFHYHVSGGDNGLASWVKDVIGDEKLARDLQGSHTRFQAAKMVADRILWLESKFTAD